jgi:CPA1 family monovalent cation:H+ antiporter
MDHRFNVVILWGGLRGALTLALALAVTENSSLEPEVRRFVGVLATGFVLFTLLVNGTTLRLLIRLLGLNRLSPLDQALRMQVLALSRKRVSDAVKAMAIDYKLPEVLVSDAVRLHAAEELGSEAATAAASENPADDHRLVLGLIAMASHERDLLLGHFAERTVSGRIVEEALVGAGRLIDRGRTGGAREYILAAQHAVDFSRGFRVAHFLHRRLSWDGPLVDRLADRFDLLLNSRIVLEELEPYVNRNIEPLVGLLATAKILEILRQRREMIATALEALRQQYPEYAQLLELRILEKMWLRREEMEYRTLFEEGVIGPELYNALRREMSVSRTKAEVRPLLDLGLEARELVAKVPMFAALTDDQVSSIARLLRPRFAVPGELLIRDGDTAHAMYFLSSGTVEVSVRGSQIKLSAGNFFGEMALITGRRRHGDVRAVSYCQLLVLGKEDLQKILRNNPQLQETISSVATTRTHENEQAVSKTEA